MADERSAGFVVFRENGKGRSYLLLEHESGRWDFPKGGIEQGETEKDAAIRELREETGISHVRQFSGWERNIFYTYQQKGGKVVHKEVVFFLCEAADEKVAISSEHVDFGWFSFKEALAKVSFDNARQTIRSAEKFLNANREK